ncbi:hypothetical protein [Enterococcus wangshanyuanii]|uniref:Rho termination factor N-terminal domain-containing protein n=1 Tax=Enterococcus wangshanyuanii TaxID=2005703 RepID=A0ABQ1NZL9_9ENTE|nr:hypothetical protein [Enterococcus wangshanyuanii]GGC88025.1 hypothetical protein GCM10011573_17040 [Enterococcus wangshanyuanii]
MEKTITIDGKQVRLRTSAATPLRYKMQFGTDYFADLLKLSKVLGGSDEENERRKSELKELGNDKLKSMLKSKNVEGYSKMNKGQLIKAVLESEKSSEAAFDMEKISFEDLHYLDTMVIYNFIWVMAKSGDENIPDPFTWLDDFETMPLEEILPEIAELLEASVRTKKK